MKKDEEKKVRTNKDTKANKSRVPSAYTRTRIILDALVFFIILLATSLSMIIISSALEEPQNYYTDYEDSDEYIEHSMQSLLSSTVTNVVVHESNNMETVYVGQTLERLILIELNSRTTRDDNSNESSSFLGIPYEVGKGIRNILGDDKKYVFTAETINSEAEVEASFVITNMVDSPHIAELSPSFEKHLTASTSNININTGEVVVRLYLM